MSFIDEIYGHFTNSPDNFFPTFKASIIGDSGAYLESVKKIISLSPDLIILALKNKIVEVSGEELKIKKYCGGDLLICGKIKGVVLK
ncbi:MAG: YabP/YqfC family sporulation protein [Clostridia bacterium]|nr:YabP/YqfC family sporulation protein [Clostridia bacterium]